MRYLPEEYSPVLYYQLRNGLASEARALSPLKSCDFDAMRNVLRKLQVEKINGFSIDSIELTNKSISVAMSAVVNERKNCDSEINRYLKRYKKRFEEDKKEGILERMVLGKQGEFDFDSVGTIGKIPFIYEKLSRQDITHHFKLRRT